MGAGVSSDNSGQRSQQKNCLAGRIFGGLSCLFCHGKSIAFFFFHGGSENHLAINTAIAWPTHMIQSLYSNVTSVRQILGT